MKKKIKKNKNRLKLQKINTHRDQKTQRTNSRTYWKLKRLWWPFPQSGAARNIATDAEIPNNITNGLLTARKYNR